MLDFLPLFSAPGRLGVADCGHLSWIPAVFLFLISLTLKNQQMTPLLRHIVTSPFALVRGDLGLLLLSEQPRVWFCQH